VHNEKLHALIKYYYGDKTKEYYIFVICNMMGEQKVYGNYWSKVLKRKDHSGGIQIGGGGGGDNIKIFR
jgi:hypothetical protein